MTYDHLWPQKSSKEFRVMDWLWCVRYYAGSIHGEDVMSFGWSREIVYWYYHSYILDHHHLHQSTNKKICRCFVIKWFGLKCIHRFILCENWRVCDTFGPIFPGAHCRVRPPWFTFPKSVWNPFLWDVKHFQISHLSEVNNVESFSELGESRTVYNRPPTNSSNSLQ